jgi:hypothetical protein
VVELHRPRDGVRSLAEENLSPMELELSTKPISADCASYGISFEGETVYHLKISDFSKIDVEEWIEFFGTHSQVPIIKVQSEERGLNLVAVDRLALRESWQNRLRLHHALARSYFERGIPTYAYESFHFGLMLDSFSLQEFEAAWVAESIEMGQQVLRERLSQSPDHIKLYRSGSEQGYYFRKTPFVLKQIQIATAKRIAMEAAEIQAKKAADELEGSLRRKRMLALSQSKPEQRAYTITLAPGVVRYVPLHDFLEIEVSKWIELIGNSASEPTIKTPNLNYSEVGGVDLRLIDLLFPKLAWDDRLRLHHKFAASSMEQGLPAEVYAAFHTELALLRLEIEACLEAWIKDAWVSDDIAESYSKSPNHVVVRDNRRIVFAKTPFVSAKLAVLEAQAKQERENAFCSLVHAQEEQLRRSKFDTFVYIMEDLRNGLFKIGHSMNPEKRERTLQSEVPQVEMRFSIPGEERHEKELHDNYSAKRIRGEWFSLDAKDLVRVISFLRENGDAERVWINHEWFGRICFQGDFDEMK